MLSAVASSLGGMQTVDDEQTADDVTVVRRPALSPSRASDFMQCPLLYRFRVVDRLPEPPSEAAARGTVVHAVLERLFDLPAPARTLEAARDLLGPEWDRLREVEPELDALFGTDTDTLAVWLDGASGLLGRYFKLEDPTRLEPAERELYVETDLDDGLRLRGYVDRLDVSPSGDLRIVDYKGLALDTPLPTPSGWTTMGEVRVGDSLIGANGEPCRVIGKSAIHHRPCYQVAFTDGSRVISDNVHLWSVQVPSSSNSAYAARVLSTDDLHDIMAAPAITRRGRRRPFIRATAPVELPDAELPIPPWLLGAWLGDGHTWSSQITVGRGDRDDMLRLFKEHWSGRISIQPASETGETAITVSLLRPRPDLCPYGHDSFRPHRKGDRYYRRCRQESRHSRSEAERWNTALSELLTRAGLRGHKHIPVIYLRASREQRLGLLQGLMDTDGSWNGQRNRAVFVTTTPALAHGVRELVHSLGGTSDLFTKGYTAKQGPRTVHVVQFRPNGFNPFSLPRKAVKVDAWFACSPPLTMGGVPRENRRTIASVVPVESVPTQCVMVDAPDSLYLCGDTFIPTHNTGRSPSELFERKALFQMKFYALVLWRVRGVVPRMLQLVYLGNGEVLRYSPDADELLATERKVQALWQAIQRAAEIGQWQPSTSRLCDWCHFQALCPAFGGTPPPLPADAVQRASGTEAGRVQTPGLDEDD